LTTEVVVPGDLCADGAAAVVMWLYEDGDVVGEGSVIAELVVEKVDVDLPAPASGTLRLLVPHEAEVAQGARIALIET
jgi:pyruvate/2-oxoglutarate dehydrogenase complex dihydrolipoamide acyltransferase (E2) component